jgi:putative endopeptidase
MQITRKRFFLAHVLVCAAILYPLLTAGSAASAKKDPAREDSATPPTLPTGPAVNLSYMDRAIRPGDDFYDYADGEWIKHTEIPADRPATAPALPLADEMDKRVAGLIAEAAKSAPAGDKSRKIADLYNSFMDEKGIEAKGLTPLQPHLAAIAAIQDKRELARALGETLRADVDALNNSIYHTPNLFGLWVAPGFNEVEHYTAYLMQGGLGLPDREYYLSDSADMRDIRGKYQAHVALMLKLAGFDDTEARAARIIELEHAIAEKHISLAEKDDSRRFCSEGPRSRLARVLPRRWAH